MFTPWGDHRHTTKPGLTWPAGMCPGHHAIAGSLIPPSNVVCFPHRKGPLLPPAEDSGCPSDRLS